jgi:hypothetical protein
VTGVQTCALPISGRSPVGNLGWYGHAFGVNWLWALGLTAFHAVYSIALPILLTQLWFPAVKNARWMDAGASTLVAGVYVFVVALFATVVGYGPSPSLLAFFLGILAVLVYLAYRAPADLLAVRPGRSRVGPWGLALDGALFFAGWTLVLVFAGLGGRIPAWGAGLGIVAISLGALLLVLRCVGVDDLDRSKFYFAAGMMGILFAWDFVVEFSIPGILLVSAAFAYLLYRLYRTLVARERTAVPAGARGASLP